MKRIVAADGGAAHARNLATASDRQIGLARILQRAAFARGTWPRPPGMASEAFEPAPLYLEMSMALADPDMRAELVAALTV